MKQALARSDLSVTTQGGHRDCLYEGDIGRFRTRPDIIVRRGSKIHLIIDTKWKRISPHIDDPKQGVSQSDMYQLMAYGQLYDCQRMVLLYPHHHELGASRKPQDYAMVSQHGDRKLTVATIDVATAANDVRKALVQLVERCIPLSECREL